MTARYATSTAVVAFILAAPSGLAVGAVGSGGTFAAATYFWKITFTSANGETTGSNEATVAIVLNGSASLTWTAPPANTTSVKVYRGTVTNTENVLVATLAGNAAAYTDTGTAGTAATVPSVNSAVTATELVVEGSLRDSASAVVTAFSSMFSTTAPVAGVGKVTGIMAGRYAAYPAGTEL